MAKYNWRGRKNFNRTNGGSAWGDVFRSAPGQYSVSWTNDNWTTAGSSIITISGVLNREIIDSAGDQILRSGFSASNFMVHPQALAAFLEE